MEDTMPDSAEDMKVKARRFTHQFARERSEVARVAVECGHCGRAMEWPALYEASRTGLSAELTGSKWSSQHMPGDEVELYCHPQHCAKGLTPYVIADLHLVAAVARAIEVGRESIIAGHDV